MGGLARAAFRTDSVIIDSGICTGIEKHCLRRNVPLIGVFPELDVTFPKIHPSKLPDNQVTDGHTHLFMVTDKLYQKWGDESKIIISVAENISKGDLRSREKNIPVCKKVIVVLGEEPNCLETAKLGAEKSWPIILIPGSALCDRLIACKKDGAGLVEGDLGWQPLLNGKNLFVLPTQNSEDLSAFVHFFLTITPYAVN